VEQELNNNRLKRRRQWSRSIAIGSNAFVEKIQNQLKEKSVMSCRKPSLPYSTLFDGEKGGLSYENTNFCELCD